VHQVAPGRVLVSIPGLARALVNSDGEVALETEPGADPADVRWFMERPVSEVHQLTSERFALRAATVVVRGGAVALVGSGAAGKSTVAAALAVRGHKVLSDHCLPLDVDEAVVAKPRGNQLELWPDAGRELGFDPERGHVLRPGLAKRAHRFAGGEAAPLALIVILDRVADVRDPRPSPVLAGDTVEWLFAATAVNVLLEPLGLRPEHFAWMVRVGRGSEVMRLEIDRDRADPRQVADAVEELLG
jgi:hypothetical protein